MEIVPGVLQVLYLYEHHLLAGKNQVIKVHITYQPINHKNTRICQSQEIFCLRCERTEALHLQYIIFEAISCFYSNAEVIFTLSHLLHVELSCAEVF